MKTKLLLKTILLSFLIIACRKLDYYNSPEKDNVDKIESSMANVNHVSKDDMDYLLSNGTSVTKTTESPNYVMTPYVINKTDTVLYIVNFKDGGWRIYSSDKRTPAIIAEGEKGYFSIEEGSPAVSMWIHHMGYDILKVSHSKDEQLIFTDEEINDNISFWEESRALPPPTPADDTLIVPITGHWEEFVTTEIEEYDRIDHLVGKWDQELPYNYYCPCRPDGEGNAYAGCVAIAGSQVLHYLHYKIGHPTHMYSQCSCTGDVNNYQRDYANLSESIWDSMSTGYNDSTIVAVPESILIAYVGDLVGMHYVNNFTGTYSWALPGNLKSNVFEYYGIRCSRGAYNENAVRENMQNQMPVIVSGSNLAIPVDGDIHCFVIDGYRRNRYVEYHHHYYVYDTPPSTPVLEYPEYITCNYSSPIVTEIKINWGWKSQWHENNPVNDGWYALTGGWVVDWGSYDYNYYLNMTYDFSF